MSHWHHPGRIVLGLALASALCVGTARAAEVDKYLPDDTMGIVSINVRQLLDSPLAKKYAIEAIKAEIKKNADAQKMLTATGLDPMKDVDSVVIGAPAAKPDKIILIIHGRFDPAKFDAAAEEFAKKNPGKLTISKDGDLRIYENKADKSPSYAAFVDKTTAVASPSKDTVLAVARNGGKSPPKLKKEFQDLIGKVDEKQAIWLASLVPSEVRSQLAAMNQTKDIADKLNAFSGGIAVDKDVVIGLHIHTADAKTADKISDTLDGLKAFPKLLVGQQYPDAAPLVDELVSNLKIGSEKETVNISLKISEDLIGKGVKNANKKPKDKP